MAQAAPTVEPITTAEWPTKARRPPNSRLDCGKLEAVFGLRLPPGATAWTAPSMRSSPPRRVQRA